ncbi:tyrosine-type recombinase/integrase [Bdellovibrio bacteriovorus]|uniref:tyrosine-type recombinase/integrase n=1 Tax=Bdellovibrio bacteriovorus TaxID=959 RepID=UPI0035A6D94A
MQLGRRFLAVKNKPGVQKAIWYDLKTKLQIRRTGQKEFRVRRRLVDDFGDVHCKERWFYTVAEAWDWKNDPHVTVSAPESFEDWARRFMDDHKHVHEATTVVRYEDILRRSIAPFPLWSMPMVQISLKEINSWLIGLVNGPVTKKRKAFHHELDLVRAIMNYWGSMSGVPVFRFSRLYSKAVIRREQKKNKRKITYEEIFALLEYLGSQRDAEIMVPLTAMMYFCALRVSEVTALTNNDVSLVVESPSQSKIVVSKAVKYLRKKDGGYYVNHYKNAEVEDQEKVLPVVPELFELLVRYKVHERKGVLFSIDGNGKENLSYKFVQYRLQKALKKFGWHGEVTSTHFGRHGGATWFYNMSGDKRIAGQILGDKSSRVIDEYIKDKDTLAFDFVGGLWNKGDETEVWTSPGGNRCSMPWSETKE